MEYFNGKGNEELKDILKSLNQRYMEFKSKNLKLNMARGKPCPEQLDISMGIFDNIRECYRAENGTDCRNYGVLEGLPEARKLFADLLDVKAEEVIAGGNSSLNMMHDSIARAITLGVYGGLPWSRHEKIKFLCPSPGYDRHFGVCELFGIEMITVEMKEDGPDMDRIEQLVSRDETIKGIWCVPKYSNPDGITYSDEAVERFACMETKAEDFRIFWDNAYCVHHLYDDERDELKDILEACKAAGNPDRVYIFASTSKITFPGAGIAAMAASENNIKHIVKQMSKQTIGPEKMNQLRHVRFFNGSVEKIQGHMKKHAEIITPKFEAVFEILEKELGNKNIARWSKPRGGYFISYYTMDGCAGQVAKMASEAGVTMTAVGATYPYGKDPADSNIRIAPTFPSLEELKTAIEILAVCTQIAAINKILK